ncbi:hypothetical protein FALBO_9936 [Fusarium albosuccineum]|uniref:Uncharacterized protein n=1 Tax=Fusarium albosuccineum TaxID=1237068 RepID=A0A8H4L8Q9_9HYPO|nr:hypothetical protein FALBO_9936 [Fusarium albosuccineum]
MPKRRNSPGRACPTNKAKHDFDRRRWQAHVEPGNATRSLSHFVPEYAKGCQFVIWKVIIPDCRWFARQARVNDYRLLRNLEWTWAWTVRRRHGPPASALPAQAATQSSEILAREWAFQADSPGLAPPFQTAGTRRSKHIEQSKQGIPSHVEQPHTGYRTDDECRKLMARSDIELSRDRSVQTRSTDGQPPALCGSGFSRLLKLGNSRGPEPAARRRAPGAELIDPQRGTGCNCLRDGGETDDFA